MANVTIPQAGGPQASDRALAAQEYLAEKQTEEARKRRAALDAPWYTEKLDPTNFGASEFLDPQHIAMFNGTAGGRRATSFPERTLDTGLHFNPTPEGLRPSHSATGGASDRDSVSTHHPEILTAIIQDLWTPSTSHGALGQALAVATDAPPQMAGPSEPPMTISPPLDPADLPPPPDPLVFAPEGSSRAKRQADWKAQGGEGPPKDQPTQQPAEEQKRQEQQREQQRKDEEKRQREQRNK